ncbi:MAG: methyltransferase domain-containing protein [Alphaproteobacteria bacterium]|nr:methyltransferase domain-containing protein [Alphaproteobacteria bacterium]
MKQAILNLLCLPETKEPFVKDGVDYIATETGKKIPVVNNIPRFTGYVGAETVQSFGEQWNKFNFDAFKQNWLQHTVQNTFGTTDAFKEKIIVDAGAGSGMQTRWIAESGAAHVLSLELSHAVDGIIKQNLEGLTNVTSIQCSIDAPPVKDNSVDMVYCHNVIQHTPSVEKTAQALYALVKPGGELVMNCYHEGMFGTGWKRTIRRPIYTALRAVLPRCPKFIIYAYAYFVALFGIVPVIGKALGGAGIVVDGDVPRLENESALSYSARRYKQFALNTYDFYGYHVYQHVLNKEQLQSLLLSLQPDKTKIENFERYFETPLLPGMAFRITKT